MESKIGKAKLEKQNWEAKMESKIAKHNWEAKLEKARLEKKLVKLNQELKSVQDRLSNDTFVEKAPTDVVEELKGKLKSLMSDQTRIEEQIKLL